MAPLAFVALGLARCSSAEHIRSLCPLAKRELARLDLEAGEMVDDEGFLCDALLIIIEEIRSMSLQLASCVICPITRIALRMRRGASRSMQSRWTQLLKVASHLLENLLDNVLKREAGMSCVCVCVFVCNI
jgi:hypothetical protein